MHTVMHCVDTSPKLGYRGEGGGGDLDSEKAKTRSKRTKEQVQTKNRNKNNAFQSDMPAGRRIQQPFVTWMPWRGQGLHQVIPSQ